MDIGRYFVHICGLSIHVFTCMSVPVTICVSVCVIPQERKWQWGVSRPPGDWQRARSQDRGRARDTSCTCWKPLQTQETGTDPATHTSFTLCEELWFIILHQWMGDDLLLLTSRSLFLQYQSHYSRHFMTVGEKERQDREVFQRNMRNRLESFKSTRYKRHKKDRSQKKARAQNCSKTHLCWVRWTWGRPR